MTIHRFLMTFQPAPDAFERAREFEDEEKAYLVRNHAAGTLLTSGRFADVSRGAIGIFTTREAAEEFVKHDPFFLNGIVSAWTIDEWVEVVGS